MRKQVVCLALALAAAVVLASPVFAAHGNKAGSTIIANK